MPKPSRFNVLGRQGCPPVVNVYAYADFTAGIPNPYNVAISTTILGVNSTGMGSGLGKATISLPATSSLNKGVRVLVKDEAGAATANNIAIQTNSAEGGTNVATIDTNGGWVELYSKGDGGLWKVFDDFQHGVPSGTVSTVSVVTANGFSGTVANPTTTPAITIIAGAIAPTSVNGLTITTTTGTFTLTNGKTLSVSNTLTFTGTDGSTIACGAGGTVAYLGTTQTFTAQQTFSNSGGIKVGGASSGVLTLIAANSATNRTLTAPNATGTIAVLGPQTFTGNQTFSATATFNGTTTFNSTVVFGGTGGIQVTGPSTFVAASTADVPLTAQGVSGQTGSLQVWINDAGSTLASVTAAGDIQTNIAGAGYYCKQGTNATFGQATLVGGTVVVNTTKVTANTAIFPTLHTLGGIAVPAAVEPTARVAGTSFTLTSANVLDTSTYDWFFVEPS